MRESTWIFLDCDDTRVQTLAKKLRIPALAARVLLNRGYDDAEAAAFLQCDTSALHDPYLLPGMTKAVNRIREAIAQKEKICIYGDYDVDGVTATYLLYDYLRTSGADVRYYIPDRAAEGYGVNRSALENLTDCSLILTVDTGITAVEEAVYAKQLGMDLIITDHHNPQEQLPDAISVIDPKLPGSQYPFPHLAGVGVAFKLALALSRSDKAVFRRYCPIAAIGTVADIVSLTGENRILVSRGLALLQETSHIGLRALLSVSGLEQKQLTAASIGFGIGPRINAAGRIGSASAALDLLLETDRKAAVQLAEQLEAENRRRQEEEKRILAQAMETIQQQRLSEDGVIVVAGNGWHHGVIGIVSSRITEQFYKPSIVVSFDETGMGKASGRSIKGFNLFEALSACADYLEKFGGHDMAAGLSVTQENLDNFRQAINAYARPRLTEEVLTPVLYIDAAIQPTDVSLPVIQGLKQLEPCGMGNRAPVFCMLQARLKQVRLSGTHAFLTIEKHGRTITIPAFGAAEALRDYGAGDTVDIAGGLSVNCYNGVEQAQFIAKEVQLSRPYSLTRDEAGMVFVFLKTNGSAPFTLDTVRAFIRDRYQRIFTNKKILLCFQILQELDIAICTRQEDTYHMHPGGQFNGKTVLSQSATFLNLQRERQV